MSRGASVRGFVWPWRMYLPEEDAQIMQELDRLLHAALRDLP